MKTPWPYFGGKLSVADDIWSRFGDVSCYVEPFFGSGAVLLNRPLPFDGVETVNDKDGFIANFFRSVKSEPEKVAFYADREVNENDLHAIHIGLVNQKSSLQKKLEGNEHWFDAEVAGKWCWGMCCWIGSGFCSGDGPWQVVDGKLVHLGNAGMDRAGDGECGIYAWMAALANRLARVRVCCGDWRRVCGGSSGDALQHFFVAGNTCGVFLDPPYSLGADRTKGLYSHDSMDVANDVRDWAVAHGDDKRLRIALCGYEGEHDMPDDWECFIWKAQGGYSSVGTEADSKFKGNARRERVWFNKSCLKYKKLGFFT